MKTKQIIQRILILGAYVLAASSQGQTLLYDNGPINGEYGITQFGGGDAVADSFALAANSTITSAKLGIWSYGGDLLSSVQWSITTARFGGTTLASGTATTTDTQFVTTPGYAVYSDSFSITPTALSAGTYWFELDGALTAENNGYAFWDVNKGPSSAYLFAEDDGSTTLEPSESFQLSGTITSAPEPSTFALAMIGGLGLVCCRRRK
jgi:hypothetical protein